MSGSIRLTGMATGLDTDTMVEELMNVEKQSYYKAQRQQYLTEYKIEAYREVTTKLTDFSSKYLDALSSTNMKSSGYFRKFTSDIVSSVTGVKSNAVSITSTADANAGTHQVAIKQVAQEAQITGAKTTGIVKTSTAFFPGDFAEEQTIKVTIDGKTKNVKIGPLDPACTIEDVAYAIENAIYNEFGDGYNEGEGKVGVSVKTEMVGDVEQKSIQFITKNGASDLEIEDVSGKLCLLNSSSTVSLNSTLSSLQNSFSSELKFAPADEEDNPEDYDQIKFKINGKEFTYDKETTLKTIMSDINNDEEIKVNIAYNSTTGRFTIKSDQTGADEVVELEDLEGSNFFEALGFISEGATSVSTNDTTNLNAEAESQIGLDTLAEVDGIQVARSTRTFKLDGVTYQANEVTAPGEKVTVNLDIDTDTVFNSIKDFVNDYNELVDFIQGKLDEEYDRDYQPLTDDERSEMSDDEIEKWEKKSKTGLLHNDSTLRSLLNSLRSQFSGSISGMQTTFADIGIKTGTYTNGGKIILDDDGINKLKSAIANNLDDVVALFTQKSATYSAASSRSYTFDQKTVRKQEEGLMNRFYDTLEDYISTYRDTGNAKGLLLEKAGKVGDTSETTSTLSKQLIQYTKRVAELLEKVNSKYDKYYKQFSQLETAMNSLNSQSSYISQLLGGLSQ